MKPLVSVLMPVYNSARTLDASVVSILRQTLSEIQLIAVDDGSSDASPDLLDAYARRDLRVSVLHVQHAGIVGALNAGIPLCRAPYIARMDADDISHPLRLEQQLSYMRTHPDISVCSCLVRIFPRPSLLGGLLHYEHWLNSLVSHDDIVRDIFVESPVAHPSVMIRRDDLIRVGRYQDRGWAEDYDLWLRCLTQGLRFGKVGRTLVWWRHGPNRLTFSDSRYSLENFLRAKAHYLALRLGSAARPVLLWGAGRIGRRLLRHLLRERLDIQAVVDVDSNKIGHSLRGRPIIAREELSGYKGAFVIAAVGSSAARGQIRTYLRDMGAVELEDFVCAA
jgi:glycosyltransferase involved in cell wall biosynthesis